MSTRVRNYAEVEDRLAERRAFTHPSMSGGWLPAGWTMDMGKLDPEEIARFRQIDNAEPVYVVKSYWTPIAWWQDGDWYVVEQKFSTTTSKQQNYVRRAWGVK